MKATDELLALLALALTGLAACEGGGVDLNVSNTDNSTDNSGGDGGGDDDDNPCASYTPPESTEEVQGDFDGTNCLYGPDFVGQSSPLLVDLTHPVHHGQAHFPGQPVRRRGRRHGRGPGSGRRPDAHDRGRRDAGVPDEQGLHHHQPRVADPGGRPRRCADHPDLGVRTDHQHRRPRRRAAVGRHRHQRLRRHERLLLRRDARRGRFPADGGQRMLGRGRGFGGRRRIAVRRRQRRGRLGHPALCNRKAHRRGGRERRRAERHLVQRRRRSTVVENLEMYSTYDDGIEMFGGSVSFTNFVAVYVRDDSIDYRRRLERHDHERACHPVRGRRPAVHRGGRHRRLQRGGRRREPGFHHPRAEQPPDDQQPDLHHLGECRRHARLGRRLALPRRHLAGGQQLARDFLAVRQCDGQCDG